MSEQDINSYRFCSGQEPTDEMLSQIMKEAAFEARINREKALKSYFDQMLKSIDANKQKWNDRFKELFNETTTN